MKLRMKCRDKAGSWHGSPVYSLSLYLESLNSETRDRVWTAIEKALPTPETPTEKQSAIGFHASDN